MPTTDRAAGQDRRLAGRYRLGRVLGRGGSGVVREGEDTLLRRRVAIKEVRLPPLASQADRDVFGERVLREVRAAARLHHPGLVTVYDVINADERPWIVMEYVDGSSLAELIRESGRLSPPRVARIGVSLAYALEAAHRAGVVHRDVKPGNVLVASDGQVRLTDFGIAVIEGDATLTSTGMLVGSPGYIPPERARGGRAGAAGDVWGLGATLFAAVEGDSPFAADSPIATLTAVVEDRRRPFRYAGALRGVLTELLAPDPARRPSLAEARGRLREIAESLEEEDATLDGRAQPGATTVTPPATLPAAGVDEALAAGEGRTGAQVPPRAAAGVPPRATTPGRGPDGAGDPALTDRHDTDVAATQEGAPAGGAAGTETGLDVLTGESPVPRAPLGARRVGAGRDDVAADPDGAGSGRGAGHGVSRVGFRWARRSRTMLLAVVTAALLATAAVTLSLVLTGGSHPSAAPTGTNPATPPPGSTSTATPNRSTGPSTRPSATSPTGPSGAGGTSAGDFGALVPITTAPAAAPAGFASYIDPSGWSAALPATWRPPARGNNRVTFVAPSGFPSLLIEVRAKAGPSAIAAWHDDEPGVRATSPGYRLLSIRPADGRDGTNAAIWEFTVTSGGRTIHVLDFGVVRNGHGYGLLWRVPEDQWQGALDLLRTIVATFRPGP
jgi:eukaryotic-like serine/threonine-protein kinase